MDNHPCCELDALRKKISQHCSLFVLIGLCCEIHWARRGPGSHYWTRGASEECSKVQVGAFPHPHRLRERGQGIAQTHWLRYYSCRPTPRRLHEDSARYDVENAAKRGTKRNFWQCKRFVGVVRSLLFYVLSPM